MGTISVESTTVANTKRTADPLLWFAEYMYYALIFYSVLGGALGLRIRLLGAGLLLFLGLICLIRLGPQSLILNKSLFYPFGCAVSFILIQSFYHMESLGNPMFRSVILWIMSLCIIHALYLRKGFFERFAISCFLIGLCLLPFLSNMTPDGEYERFGLERSVGLNNPNVLAGWFGFCGVVFFIMGLEAKFFVMRMISWAGTLVCVFVIGLTISRLSLVSVAMAIIIASRHLLKRGLFIALIFVCIGGWFFYEIGIFEKAIDNYTLRASEETGRLTVWPLVLERIVEFPLTGVGVSEEKTHIPSKEKAITPHNGFLYIALVSGVIPLVFFVAYWVRAGIGAWRTGLGIHRYQITNASYRLPLLMYAFLSNFATNTGFMSAWMMVVLTMMTAKETARPIRLPDREKQKRSQEHFEEI